MRQTREFFEKVSAFHNIGIWSAEISFRYLKHAAGLLYFHSKKPDFLKQEIYATWSCITLAFFSPIMLLKKTAAGKGILIKNINTK